MTAINLTPGSNAVILNAPSTLAVGICTPFERGHKAATIAVFLCPHYFKTGLIRLFSMVGCIGQPLKRLAAPRCGSANLIQSTAQSFAPFDGGLSLLTRIQTMPQNKSVQNPQTITISLFNLFLYRRQIASNIPGTKAERIKRRNPACVVKFSHMEVSAHG